MLKPGSIDISHVSKVFRIGHAQKPGGTFSDAIRSGAKNLFKRKSYEDFKALDDVSFRVEPGERVGIIGRNGAGKSTLLKILSRITPPTSGTVRLRGRVASLLEVGTGFHPELTGRENVYLNGAVLGMTRGEIRKKFDEIAAFSEVEKFIDTPVKKYSSGMYVRLAFAVAAHLDTDLLIVDEVLAVGDASFQKRCMDRMNTLSSDAGRTILLVSHSMAAIRALSSKCLMLENGSLVDFGQTEAIVEQYLRRGTASANVEPSIDWEKETAPGNAFFRLISTKIFGGDKQPRTDYSADECISIALEYCLEKNVSGLRINIQFVSIDGVVAFTTTDSSVRHDVTPAGYYVSLCKVPPNIFNARYYQVVLAADIPGVEQIVSLMDLCRVQIIGAGSPGSICTEKWPGLMCPQCTWEINRIERSL